MLRQGFSLVELSIVLVILGLLTGGILAGQSLIHASELRSVAADYARYDTAIQTFQNNYNALPGDMKNATSFWGSLGGTGSDADCQALKATDKKTCNGNGDGQILTSTGNYDERFRSWQHLADAGLIEGSYTGLNGATDGSVVFNPGSNVPRTRLNDGIFDIAHQPVAAGLFFAESQQDRNLLSIYGISAQAGGTYALLKPSDAWNIDTKMDDGNPVTGDVFTTRKSSPVGTNCVVSDTAPTTYDVSANVARCVLHMSI